ncbi:M23 family metallopeptidase [Novosphingobium flavum]|uniref:M23 family metallopeptidase n=1 Tax=Novosphingobium aerophilum TaxID=2839843 RepID=A0A7X1KD35_9SPHN|nr:M23 family metallopeptidase [Novosphingobium aerophilum]MBC2652896.1 M23 family metallopeptidase [Novosphingobium aerophilum]MBC2663059.1 M23 family metallopeptidase [Novosphingobium aerophilum]
MGIDLPGTLGDPVRAAADGVVEFAGHAGDYGYGHLHTIIVPNGSAVRADQSIGTMGNTGNAQHTGTHLHFEVAPPGSSTLRRGYRRSDPTHWIVTGVHQ